MLLFPPWPFSRQANHCNFVAFWASSLAHYWGHRKSLQESKCIGSPSIASENLLHSCSFTLLVLSLRGWPGTKAPSITSGRASISLRGSYGRAKRAWIFFARTTHFNKYAHFSHPEVLMLTTCSSIPNNAQCLPNGKLYCMYVKFIITEKFGREAGVFQGKAPPPPP